MSAVERLKKGRESTAEEISQLQDLAGEINFDISQRLAGIQSTFATNNKVTSNSLLKACEANSNWNGRVGTIVKLITEGVEEEDVGRWKVRLDGDWRGKEPDGNYEYGKRYLMLL